MFVSDSLNVNELGHLTIGGVDSVSLAKKYGTPLYILDEDGIRANCRAYVKSIEDNYGGNGLVLYASKAFSCMEMCRICQDEKMGLDVVSGGELYTAQRAEFPMNRVYFHGNNKTMDELKMAVDAGVGAVVVDNLTELESLAMVAENAGKVVNIMFRIKPGIDAHTHDFIRTGQIDSKFGFALETGEAMEAVKEAIKFHSVNLIGVHCHIGSQIFDIDPFVLAAEVMCKFIADVKSETGLVIEKLNLGGGFGIKYLESDKPVPYGEYMTKVADAIKNACNELNIKLPMILIEPGRSIIGSEGITVYTVGAVKNIPNIRTYVSVDGGMGDNPRYILYQSKYEMICANKANEEKSETVTVAGKCCESGDLLGENVKLQKLEPGDNLAVLSTGAYNYSMASNYNRIPKPCSVMVSGGKDRIIIKRETYSDLTRNDI